MRTSLLSLLLCGLLTGCASTPPPPKAVVSANTLANQALDDGRFKEAVQHYTIWLTSHPKDFDSQYGRAIALEGIGETALSIEGYSKALELRPDHLQARLRRAGAYYRAQAYDRADQDLTDVLGEGGFDKLPHHDHVMTYALLGQIALNKGLHSIALEHLDRAVELVRKRRRGIRAGHYKRLLYNRAMTLFQLSAYQMALEDYTEYAKLHGEQGQQLTDNDRYHLVLLNYLAGRFATAQKHLAGLTRADRKQLSTHLDDPGFFLGDPSVAATTTSK